MKKCVSLTKFPSLKGFTLVELLVVISIIALLLSVLMPALSKAREQSRKVVCRSHLKSIGLGTALYTTENKGFFPGIDKGWSYSWYLVLAPYINAAAKDLEAVKGRGGNNVFVCPSSESPNRTEYMDYVAAQGKALTTDYGIIGIDYSVKTTKKPTLSRKISDIIKPNGVVVWLVEGENRSGIGGAVASDAFIWNNIPNRDWPLQFGSRHGGGDNAVFVDWHVEFRKTKNYVISDFEVR